MTFPELDMLVAQASGRPWFRWTSGGDISSEPEDCMIFRANGPRGVDEPRFGEQGENKPSKQDRKNVNAVIAVMNAYADIRARMDAMKEVLEETKRRLAVLANWMRDSADCQSLKDHLADIERVLLEYDQPFSGFGTTDRQIGGELVNDMMTWPATDLPPIVRKMTRCIISKGAAFEPWVSKAFGSTKAAIWAYVVHVVGCPPLVTKTSTLPSETVEALKKLLKETIDWQPN